MANTTASQVPKVLDKALRVLELFTERHPTWTVTEIARELGLPLTTAHRIVRGLESHRFVRRTSAGGYRLGLAAVLLGHRAAGALDLRAVFRPSLEWLSAQTDETTVVATYDDGRLGALRIDVIERKHPVQVITTIGAVTPLYVGALGRAILAHLGDEIVERVCAEGLEPHSVGTIARPAELRANLAHVREVGFAFARDDTDVGVWEMAAPILDADGTPYGSIGFLSPTLRLTPELERRGGEYVVTAAARAATDLGSGG